MNYISIPLSFLRSSQFMDASAEQIATWLKLQGYCTEQENGGSIADCDQWSTRRWISLADIDLDVLKQPSTLWEWKKGALILKEYGAKYQAEVQAKREAGKRGAKVRWSPQSNGHKEHNGSEL